ncbi:hypothetical protein GJ496_003277 [Pomphorhynchus laevis]|nr:hypothetical protein GJ496_003277 [Pomphorhynchus laevis]
MKLLMSFVIILGVTINMIPSIQCTARGRGDICTVPVNRDDDIRPNYGRYDDYYRNYPHLNEDIEREKRAFLQ